MSKTRIYTYGKNGLAITWEGDEGQRWANTYDLSSNDPNPVTGWTICEECGWDFVGLTEQSIDPIAKKWEPYDDEKISKIFSDLEEDIPVASSDWYAGDFRSYFSQYIIDADEDDDFSSIGDPRVRQLAESLFAENL